MNTSLVSTGTAKSNNSWRCTGKTFEKIPDRPPPHSRAPRSVEGNLKKDHPQATPWAKDDAPNEKDNKPAAVRNEW